MPFPQKFRGLIEIREDEVNIPDIVYLSYSVCAVGNESCGWGGWTIESAKRVMDDAEQEVFEADTGQKCPRCGRDLYRAITKQFRLNSDWEPVVDYETDEPIFTA